jgi:hypothetical protein
MNSIASTVEHIWDYDVFDSCFTSCRVAREVLVPFTQERELTPVEDASGVEKKSTHIHPHLPS